MTLAAEQLACNLLPIVRIAGEDVRYRMADRLAHYGCAGVTVAVVERGEIVLAEGYGTIDRGGRPVDAETMFSGASISKPVTATIALQLVAEGKLDLDENVNDRLVGWKIPDNEFTAQAPVTLRWLLSHKAGTNVHGFGGYPDEGPLPDLPHMLEGLPPARNPPVRVDKVPGGANRYSGGGTTIVELLIVEACGKDYAEVAAERIFAPLGMTRSTFVQPLPTHLHANAAEGVEGNGNVTRRDFRVPQVGAGGIWTTPGDYARFMIATREALLGRPNPLLDQALAQEMMTRQGGGEFGLGWSLANEGSTRYFHHSGSNQGFQSNALLYADSGDGAVVMTNSESGIMFYWEVLNGIAGLNDWPGFMPPPREIAPIAPDRFAHFVGEFAIVSGTELPRIEVFVEDGRLRARIPGMRNGENDILMDARGRIFNRNMPTETTPEYDDAGRLMALVVHDAGGAEIMRAERA